MRIQCEAHGVNHREVSAGYKLKLVLTINAVLNGPLAHITHWDSPGLFCSPALAALPASRTDMSFMPSAVQTAVYGRYLFMKCL